MSQKKNLRVATGGLDQGVARLDTTGPLCLLNHAQGNAILDTAAGIEVLQLGVDGGIDTQAAGQTVQSDQRGVADVLGNSIQRHWRNSGFSRGSHDGKELPRNGDE